MALFVNVLNSFNKRPKNKKIIKAISFVSTLTALTAVSRPALFAGPRQDPTVGCFALIRATGHATILWPEIDTMKWPQRSQSGHSDFGITPGFAAHRCVRVGASDNSHLLCVCFLIFMMQSAYIIILIFLERLLCQT